MEKTESTSSKKRPEHGQKPRTSCPQPKINEAIKWTFEETSSLMDIWSKLDDEKYESKTAKYRYISNQMKKQGFDRSTTQIRCKIQRLVSKTTCERPVKDKQKETHETLKPHKPVEQPKKPSVCRRPPPKPKKEIDFDEKVFIGSYNYLTMDVFPPARDLDSSNIINSSHYESESSSSDYESEVDIGYEIVLTEPELDSEDSIFDVKPKESLPQSDGQEWLVKGETSGQKADQKLMSAIEDVRSEASECYKDIISGQKQLKESIKQFGEELRRLTESVVNSEDNNTENMNEMQLSSNPIKKTNQSIKLVIPNVNKNIFH